MAYFVYTVKAAQSTCCDSLQTSLSVCLYGVCVSMLVFSPSWNLSWLLWKVFASEWGYIICILYVSCAPLRMPRYFECSFAHSPVLLALFCACSTPSALLCMLRCSETVRCETWFTLNLITKFDPIAPLCLLRVFCCACSDTPKRWGVKMCFTLNLITIFFRVRFYACSVFRVLLLLRRIGIAVGEDS